MSITLRSSDNEEFVVDKEVATQCNLVDSFLADHDGTDICIPLPKVDGKTLKKVIEFCEHHKDDPVGGIVYEEVPKRSDDMDPWDKEFIDVENETMFDVLLAANYMECKALLDLGCAQFANMIRNKDATTIREMFNITSDFTEEEREQIRKENEMFE
ncbi:hypothetical protein LPJ59_004494 [Coemansia sp. RSA 2399]|nr:hypothetical protein LPJ59_004494 [Coemansia sp. RSA 2399]KAJ1898895.1 hypothetical protein LPJ81_004246 [Coemansia sp. IMI 209127]